MFLWDDLLEKQPPLFRDMFKCKDLFEGHVTKEQLKPVLMQPPLFRGHPELTIIISREQVGGTIWTWTN